MQKQQDKSLYQKNGYAVMLIARDLLSLKEGGRMRTIAQYCEQLEVSRWTIQTALKFFEENHCFQLEKRGTLGTYAHHLDQKKLWDLSGWNPLIGLAPLPTCNILEGLMTGLKESFTEQGPVLLTYMLPAAKRLEFLSTRRCQFAVVSRLGMQLSREKYPDLYIAEDLDGVKYSLPFKIYFNKEGETKVRDGMTIGIYKEAQEQAFISEKICKGKNVRKKYGTYHELLRMFSKEEIDVMVYRGDDQLKHYLKGKEGISLPQEMKELDQLTQKPVIVVHKEEYGMGEILKKLIQKETISMIQKEVLEGSREPNYI